MNEPWVCDGDNRKRMFQECASDFALSLRSFILAPIAIVIVVVILITQPQMQLLRVTDRFDREVRTFHDQYPGKIIQIVRR